MASSNSHCQGGQPSAPTNHRRDTTDMGDSSHHGSSPQDPPTSSRFSTPEVSILDQLLGTTGISVHGPVSLHFGQIVVNNGHNNKITSTYYEKSEPSSKSKADENEQQEPELDVNTRQKRDNNQGDGVGGSGTAGHTSRRVAGNGDIGGARNRDRGRSYPHVSQELASDGSGDQHVEELGLNSREGSAADRDRITSLGTAAEQLGQELNDEHRNADHRSDDTLDRVSSSLVNKFRNVVRPFKEKLALFGTAVHDFLKNSFRWSTTAVDGSGISERAERTLSEIRRQFCRHPNNKICAPSTATQSLLCGGAEPTPASAIPARDLWVIEDAHKGRTRQCPRHKTHNPVSKSQPSKSAHNGLPFNPRQNIVVTVPKTSAMYRGYNVEAVYREISKAHGPQVLVERVNKYRFRSKNPRLMIQFTSHEVATQLVTNWKSKTFGGSSARLTIPNHDLI